jgi:SecD/SecF fusion protein
VVADPYNVTGKHLTQAMAAADNEGRPYLEFTFDDAGGQLFAKLTAEHLPDKKFGSPYHLGIILDGQLQSAPSIQSVISDRGEITGVFTKQDVSDMADTLNAGSLPMRLRLVSP